MYYDNIFFFKAKNYIFDFPLYFTAHIHRTDATSTDETVKLYRTTPLSTAECFRQELPSMTKDALHGIANEKFHARPSSKNGKTLITVSQQLLVANLSMLHILLVSSFTQFFESSRDSSQLFHQHISHLRSNPHFIQGMIDFILTNINFQLELRIAEMFLQQFLTFLRPAISAVIPNFWMYNNRLTALRF